MTSVKYFPNTASWPPKDKPKIDNNNPSSSPKSIDTTRSRNVATISFPGILTMRIPLLLLYMPCNIVSYWTALCRIYCIMINCMGWHILIQAMGWHILIQAMACRLFGAKPLPKPVLTNCQLDSWKQILVEFKWKYADFHSTKCIWNLRLRYATHFAQTTICYHNQWHSLGPVASVVPKWGHGVSEQATIGYACSQIFITKSKPRNNGPHKYPQAIFWTDCL